jgi:hypothetical protein
MWGRDLVLRYQCQWYEGDVAPVVPFRDDHLTQRRTLQMDHRFVRMALGLASVLVACAVTVIPVAAGDDGDTTMPPAEYVVVSDNSGEAGKSQRSGVEWTRDDRDSGGIMRPLGVEWTLS